MKLGEYLAAERIVVQLPAATLQDALRALFDRLEATGAIAHPARLRARLDEQRPEDMVAMGDRAFVLHYRTDAVRDLLIALGTGIAPICRSLGDEGETQCAQIVVLVVAPPRLAARYLQVVGALATLLSGQELVAAVLSMRDPQAIAALGALAAHELPEQLAVRDLMTEHPRVASPDVPLRDAADEMVRAGVGGLPVVDSGGRVVGMLSERELLRHLQGAYLSGGPKPGQGGVAGRRTVRDAMTRQVLCVSPEQPIAEIASLMSNKDVDRVPVVREGRLVGLLTRGDIVRKLIGS